MIRRVRRVDDMADMSPAYIELNRQKVKKEIRDEQEATTSKV